MPSLIPLTNYLRKSVARALSIQGDDFQGTLEQSMRATVVADELTDQRSLYLRGGMSWEAGIDAVPTNGLVFPGALLRPRVALPEPTKVLRLLRVRRITVWTASTPAYIGYAVFNAGYLPAITSALNIDPTVCDGRMAAPGGSTQTSLYQLVAGLSIAGPITGGDGYGYVRPGTASFAWDPRITLRYGDGLFLAGSNESTPWGCSINWEEYPATPQEFAGDAAWPGSV